MADQPIERSDRRAIDGSLPSMTALDRRPADRLRPFAHRRGCQHHAAAAPELLKPQLRRAPWLRSQLLPLIARERSRTRWRAP
jgi:hypothetical protein